MIRAKSQQITQLLIQWSEGNDLALEELMPLVYEELRLMAHRHMSGQNKRHTFQTTELIHEAYIKLAKKDDQNWDNRAHFFGVASKAMRQILVDYARSKKAQKRGDAPFQVTLEESSAVTKKDSDDIIALDMALVELGKLDERKCRVVEMKYFGGLTIDEIAKVLKISRETVKRDWRFSRTWLLNQVGNN